MKEDSCVSRSLARDVRHQRTLQLRPVASASITTTGARARTSEDRSRPAGRSSWTSDRGHHQTRILPQPPGLKGALRAENGALSDHLAGLLGT